MSEDDQSLNSENSGLYNLQEDEDDDDEEEDDGDMIRIQLKSNLIEFNYSQLYKYSQLIKKEYTIKQVVNNLPKLLRKYEREYGIQEKNIVIFFKIIQDQNIKITSSCYCDLFKLASLFKVIKLKKFLNKYVQKHSKDVSFISAMLLEQKMMANFGISYDEEKMTEMTEVLTTQINKSLEDNFFNELPISFITEIIAKSDKDTISSDLLYDFIKKSVYNRYIFFEFIEIEKLSEDRLIDIYSRYQDEKQGSNKQRYFEGIGNSVKYLVELIEYKKKGNETMNDLMNQNIEVHQDLEQLISINEKRMEENRGFEEENQRLRAIEDELDEKIAKVEEDLNNEEQNFVAKQVYYDIIKCLIDSREDEVKDANKSGILNF